MDGIGGFITGVTSLPTQRQAVVDETHLLISSRWTNSGLVSGLYRIEPFGVSLLAAERSAEADGSSATPD